MKITIYELLGLIKDDKAPKTIKYDNYIWTLRTQFNDYWNDASYLITNGFDEWENSKDFLKETVEIIEEEKEIEKIDNEHDFYCYTRYDSFKNDIDKVLYLINGINATNDRITDTNLKLNELIDEVKKLKEE